MTLYTILIDSCRERHEINTIVNLKDTSNGLYLVSFLKQMGIIKLKTLQL